MSLFKGSGVAIVTPFHKNEVNYNKLEELINWHVQNSTDAIIICGTTGESPTLSKEEKRKVIAFAVEKTNKRIPVIAGTGSNNTKEVIDMSMYAEEVGADGLLVVTPYYNKCTQNGLFTHFTAIADAVNIPIILYNVPGRTGVNIGPETVAKLANHKNIVGIKEAGGDISQVAKIARLCPTDFGIYSGNDDQIVPTLSLGGIGVISVVANIVPKETHNLVQLYLDGQTQEATKLQLSMLDLINSLFIEVNPIPVKAAMNILGMEVGNLRMPLTEMEEHNKLKMTNEMKAFGLLKS